MAFSNIDVFNLCKFIVSKESLSGYMNITDFNLNLRTANILLLKEKLGMSNDYGVGIALSRQQKGISIIHDDTIRKFKTRSTVSFSSGIGTIPATYFKYDDLRVNGALEPVEMLNSSELSKRLNNAIDEPDVLFPAAEIVGNSIYIYPSIITSGTLTYYRYPATCSLSYFIDVNGEIVPMAAGETHTLATGETGMNGETEGTVVTSTTVEHEWDESNGVDLAYIILKNLGISLNRADIYQVADKFKKEGI